MKKKIWIISLSLFILGYICFFRIVLGTTGNGTTLAQQSYLDNLKESKPTKKELIFISNLKKNGYFNIKIHKPIPGYVCKGCSFYTISMSCPFFLNEKNKDSIIKANENIAMKLYSSIIEDSTIMEFGELDVEFNIPKSKIKLKKWHHILIRSYNKPTLENWSDFNIIETNFNNFKRVKK